MSKYPILLVVIAFIAFGLTGGMLGYNLMAAAPLREILASLIAILWSAFAVVLLINDWRRGI